MNIREIVQNAGMSARPEFFSGRGAITTDLNSTILEKIFQGIETEYGSQEAINFAQMVADTDKLSATLFLNNLYRLEMNGWQNWTPETTNTMDHTDLGPDHETRDALAFVTIAEAMFGRTDRDETSQIVGQFLMNHASQIKLPKPSRRVPFMDNRGMLFEDTHQ